MTRLSYADVCELELSIDNLDEPLARLIAQALEEGLMLVTSDQAIMRYDVPVLEA